MNILLLDRDENLIDYIDIFDPEDEESLNADSTLTFSTFYKNIEKGYRILYQDRLNEWHEYIIQSIKNKHNSSDDIFLEVYAENSFYETLGDYIEDKRPRNSTATNALSEALATSRWEVGVVENLGLNTTSFYRCSVKDAVQNKIVKVWDGEFSTSIKVEGNKIVSRKVNIFKKRGDDHGKRFVYGKDIHEIEKVVNEEDIITALYGFGKGEEIEETGGHGRRIDFADINNGKKYVENNTARLKYGRNSDKGKVHVFGKIEFDDITDKRELLAKTKEELEKASTPKITYNAAVEDLVKHGFEYEGVRLGDTVTVIDEELGLRLKARVIKLVKNLDNSSADKITLGNFVETTNDLFIEAYKKINDFRNKEAIWDSASKKIQDGIDAEFLNNVIDKLNTEINNSGGYVYISKDGKGIITYDKPLDQNPTKAIQLMGGSIRIANKKKSDGTWDWRSFGTGDGFVADEIITGILKGGNVKWNLNDGTFLIGESEDNYLLKFDGSTLKFGSGSIGKSDLSEELKQELKGKDGESFKYNLISNGDFHIDFTKDEPGHNSKVLNRWQAKSRSDVEKMFIKKPSDKSWIALEVSATDTIEINQYLNLKKNTKYYIKATIASEEMKLYYHGSHYSTIIPVKDNYDHFTTINMSFTTHDSDTHFIQLDCKKKTTVRDVIISEEPISDDTEWYPSKFDGIGQDGKPGRDGRDGERGAPGPPGRDGSMVDLPPALKDWSGKATEISGKYVFTPELFVGTNGDSKYSRTGIYMGSGIKARDLFDNFTTFDGITGINNGTATWHLSVNGNGWIGNSQRAMWWNKDGELTLPKVKAREIEAGAITTDILYPGLNNRIVLESGYNPGDNDCMSIDTNTDSSGKKSLRLKVNAGTYLRLSKDSAFSFISRGNNVLHFDPRQQYDLEFFGDRGRGTGKFNMYDAYIEAKCYEGQVARMGIVTYEIQWSTSDKRLKTDIEYLSESMISNLTEFIKKLNIAEFYFKSDEKKEHKQISVIAQDVIKDFPELKNYIVNEVGEYYTVNSNNINFATIVTLQEEMKKREAMEDKVNKLENELEEIKKLLKKEGE
jgi:phage minor structural protein